MLEAYITNLGRYNEGFLDGEYLKLPATKEEVQELLQRIHVDGVQYEEIFITDYETDIHGLYNLLGEYESIDELSYFTSKLNNLENWELEKLGVAIQLGEDASSVKDLINLCDNLDCYEYYPEVKDDDDLGRYLIEELGWEQIPEWMTRYFDYEAYGRDYAINAGGNYFDEGYAFRNDDSFVEHYTGRKDIPEEHRIFAYPEPTSIKDSLMRYSQLQKGSLQSKKEHNAPTTEER